MCCIFTCCGWMIDLIQRFWTFTMACCISSAVCCALVTASMAGIALGYNYSLAEYIDLKETNVSVYLKRGVFDDEIADDMDWRRSGHMPVKGHLNEDNLVTGGMEGPEEMPLRSGRRLEDSLILSDDKHKFEGSLMRLTARPPDARRSEQTQEPVTSDERIAEIMRQYPMGSLEQMKAIHSLMNMRRSGGERHTVLPPTQSAEGFEMDGRRAMFPKKNPTNMHPLDYGPINSETYKKMNPARFAVPDESIRDPANWFLPKNEIPESYKRTMDLVDYENLPSSRITRPQPFRMSTEIQRPSRPTTHQRPTPTHTAMPQNFVNQETAILGSPFDKLKNKLLMGNMGLPGFSKDQAMERSSGKEFKSDEDYEEEANKGLPIRKKRNKRNVANEKTNSLHATFKNGYGVNLNETVGNKTSKLISKPKSVSSMNLQRVNEESSTSKLNVSSIEPSVIKEYFLKIISRFVFL